jgi:hypothetical protein
VGTRFKVVETSSVTDEELESILNEWTEQGWKLDNIQFAMRESERRRRIAAALGLRSAPRR